MKIVCLDVEGTLTPEIWIAFAEAANVPELRVTTREEPDYDKLMKFRINVLKEHGLGLKKIQDVIDTIDPLPGAREFIDALREEAQVILISDTFEQFAAPLVKKLGMPTIMCNTLIIGEDGMIEDYAMRCTPSKLTTINALKSCGYETIAGGDSLNDIQMIENSAYGFFMNAPEGIKAAHPAVPAFDNYDDALAAIKEALRA